MKKIKSFITVGNKKYEYSLKEKQKGIIFFECKDANISQNFLKEDVVNLIIDLPNLIVSEKEYNKNQSKVIRFRVSPEDKNKVERRAIKKGFKSVSDYMRSLALG